MKQPLRRPLPVPVSPAGVPVLTTTASLPGAASVVTAPAPSPVAATMTVAERDDMIARRVAAARGPLGAPGPHGFGLLVPDLAAGDAIRARAIIVDNGAVQEAVLPLTVSRATYRGAEVPMVQVPATAIELHFVPWVGPQESIQYTGKTEVIPWTALELIPDGSDLAIVHVRRSFWQRHKHHILLGGAVVAVGGAVALLSSSSTRDNPGCGCGPSCGCAPCRAKYHGARSNPSRGRRTKSRGRKGSARR